MSFVHLHVHSHYSFLTGLWKPSVFVKRAKELEMPGVALTDAWNLYGAFEFFKSCKENGINPIIGVEASISKKWMTNRDKDNEIYSIVLLARNFDGYKNLIQLVTESFLHGSYNGRARIDFELLEKYRHNLIALSGCHLGEIPQHIITGKSEEFIVERINYYQDLFGKDDFYLEIQEHPSRANQPKVNEYLVNLSKKYGFKLVATNHVYYATENDAEAQDLLYCIGDGRALEDPDRPTLIEGNYSLRSAAEMEELFSYAPSAVKNTLEINEKIKIDIPYGKTLIPVFQLGPREQVQYEKYKDSIYSDDIIALGSEEWNLRDLCITGLNRRYDFGLDEATIHEFVHKKKLPAPEKKLSQMSVQELIELSEAYYTDKKREIIAKMTPKQQEIVGRLEYELTVVDLMGFNGYFNIVSDFINYSKEHDVPVGPWRGSAAGAILAYLSGITDIDPLRYGLLFERFLNPSRVSMPDIDVDFSDEGRDKVLEYVRKKYGEDHVAQVCTFGTMAARAAVKDVGKVLGVPFSEMNNLAKLMPNKPGTKIKEALEESVEFHKAVEENPRYKKVVENAIKLEGSVRQLGVHACAVIIAPEQMTNYCALQHPPKDIATTVTQLSQYPLEELGLLKMDFLGLRNLTIIKRCLKIIKANHDRDIDLLKINYEDKKVFQIFANGDTTGVFQFESSGMRKYLKELKPNTFEDIIVMVSLYRPGPLAYIPTYINRKHGKEKVSYPHPSLEAILKPTQGIAVYQEQIMQLVQAFAGFSLGEADILRRAIGKKKVDLLMEQKEKFINAAKDQGHPVELARYIFEDIIEPFAGYGFNKSHAACYSMISYQTAHLKAYYPTEFMTALMVSDEEDMERITMEIEECKAKGINILPPDVNESMKHFTFIDNKNIRFGLKAIKGLGDGPIESIQDSRKDQPFESIMDFINENTGDVINKKSLEALILSGALDRFGERADLFASIPKIIAFSKENDKKAVTSQMGLFDMVHEDLSHMRFQLEKTTPMSFEEKIRWEKQSIGYSVSGHGLDGLRAYISKRMIGKEYVEAFKKEMAEKEIFVPEFDAEGQEMPRIETVVEIKEVKKEDSTEELMEEATTTEAPVKEKKKEPKKKDPKVRFIGLISSIRKIQTKTGKMMLVANCDSFDFRFSVVVFPKDYETYSPLFEEDKIVLVEGGLRCNPENAEINVMPTSVRVTTITTIRQQAMDLWLFNPRDKVSYYSDELAEKKEEPKKEPEAKIEQAAEALDTVFSGAEYVIRVPESGTKQDLIDLKSFLQNEESGGISIKLNIKGQIIDTKMSIASTANLKLWTEERWQGQRV